MLKRGGLCDSLPDIPASDFDMFSRLQRVVKQDTVEDNALLARGEVTPATHADERTSIACPLRNKQDEKDSSEDGNQSLN